MMGRAYFKDLHHRLVSAWNNVRMQTSGFTTMVLIAILVCLSAGIALQQQASSQNSLERLATTGPAQLRMTEWTAEYFACPGNQFEGQCKRVLQKNLNGQYSVAAEQLPLGRGRFVNNNQFSERPTHVRLSHRLTQDDQNQIEKNWSGEKPVFALMGQPVCQNSKCRDEDIVVPMNKLSFGNKTWVQFDSQIAADGRFGPQAVPPVVVSQSKVHELFAVKTNHQRGLFFEFGMALIAPFFAIALTLWTGKPKLYVAFSQFLTVKALWTLTAVDVLVQQPVFFKSFTLTQSFALAAFVSGWMFCSAMNLLSVVWSHQNLSRRQTTNFAAGFAIIALAATYFSSAGTTLAVTTLRALEFMTVFSCALILGLAHISTHNTNLNYRWIEYLRNSWRPEQGTRTYEQIKGLLASFAIASAGSLWVMISAHNNTYTFNWGTLLLPMMLMVVFMYCRPQLTQADLQVQKDIISQQEILVKLLAQLGSVKHRVQAISLVVNFCNRELPKLGFEPPQFLEVQPQEYSSTEESEFALSIASAVRGPHQTFGWIVARARKRTENTAIGERMVEALSTSLAQHLDTLIRSSILESEASSAQKFVPRDLVRFFGIMNLSQLDATQEYSINGTIVNVMIRPSGRGRDMEILPERGIINELTSLFQKGAADFGGYLAFQEGIKWTIVFRDTTNSALKWIESTQNALRSWNQHRQTLGMTVHDCGFGAHTSTLVLRFTDSAGLLRPWIQGDIQGIANTLSDTAAQYQLSVLLSQDYVTALGSGRMGSTLPEFVRPIDRVWNRSKSATVDVFEFFGGESDLRRVSKQKTVELFSQGVKLYLSGHFDGARTILNQIVEADPNDKTAQRLLATLSQSGDLKAA